MSAQTADLHNTEETTREEQMSFLFAQMVIQQSNMAMMLMGKVAHPETGQAQVDIEGARLFIDQLEMLEAKTKGNLSKEEESLLKQTLMSLRLTFVQAVESAPGVEVQPKPPAAAPAQPASSGSAQSEAPAAAPEEDEHRKKFTKKY
jgi:uncharacterized protein DUF1844